MRNAIYTFVTLIVVVITLILVAADRNTEDRKVEEIEPIQTVEIVKVEKVEPVIVNQNIMIAAEVEEEPEHPQRPKFKNPIPLPERTLDKIYEISQEYEISYTLILANAQVESNFDPEAKSQTGDAGLMQINRRSQKWLAELAELDNVQPTNPTHSVLMAAEYLIYLRDYFDKYGLSEEDKFNYIVGGYNYGHAGIKRYARKYDVSQHPYVLKVLAAKSHLEQDIVEEGE